jgi:hypothetical protein
MDKSKIQNLLKKILLEEKPKEYCSNYGGKYTMTVDYKNCRINISHNPIVETKKTSSWFCRREVEVSTGKSYTHVYIYPHSRGIDSSHFCFKEGEILPYLIKYVERYNLRELNKKNKFLSSLCDE